MTKLKNGQIVQNPLNLYDFKPLPYPTRSQLRMATVGHLVFRWKGQDILLEALSEGIWKKRDWRLTIYGKGEDENNIRALIQHYGLEDKVFLKGVERDLKKIWSKEQVLIMPSRVESSPLSVVEAMIYGRPVVTTDIGDMSKFYVDGESGFLAEAATTKYLKSALEKLWKSKDKLKEMGENAHQTSFQRCDKFPEKSLLSIIVDGKED